MNTIKFKLLTIIYLFSTCVTYSQTHSNWNSKLTSIYTPWAQEVSPTNVLPEYPRPQMVRENWENLNGLWKYTITPKDAAMPSAFADQILVPFPLESALSGVKKPLLPNQNLWYKRTFNKASLKNGEHVLLHFGAVDWQATIYVNGKETGTHTGGYQSFYQDITAALKNGENEIVVKVYDPTSEGVGPHGKQVLNPANIYYTPSSGIWQTVWIETVPSQYINRIKIIPDIDKEILNIIVDAPSELQIRVTGIAAGSKIGTQYGKAGAVLHLRVKNPHLWSPADPFLYDLNIELIKNNKVIDRVNSYFGMRKIAIQKDEKGVDRIFLNNKSYFNLGTLDQGFWPDGLYTAPTDNALKFDIEAIKAMGFNTIRKHIKVEPARWYYHTDKLGMLVWQDFVNPNQGLPEGAKAEYEKETKETLEQLHNYPSITTWVIFNEKWGAYDQQRITEWVKSSDPSRIVDGHSGELLYVNNELRSPSPNAYISSDMTDVHSYPFPRNAPAFPNKARVIGEFGGIGVPVEGHIWDDIISGWGYDGIQTPSDLTNLYSQMIDSLVLYKKNGLSGSIYTQPFDVESEQNGILTYDRSIIKMPIATVQKLNSKLTGTLPSTQLYFVKMVDTTLYNYEMRKKQFISGKNDSFFLRGLISMSCSKKDTNFCRIISPHYIKTLIDPLAPINLRFINKYTFSTIDTGFKILLRNRDVAKINLGRNVAEYTIMNIIYKEEILPHLNESNIEWEKMENQLESLYGDLAIERITQTKLLYYLNKKDWKNYSVNYKKYFENAITTNRNRLHINNMSWPIFENINDLEILQFAVKVMKYNIDKYDSLSPNSLDTYANLLYKVGNKEEALYWESKAIKLSNNRDSYKLTYEKMIRNEKTWK